MFSYSGYWCSRRPTAITLASQGLQAQGAPTASEFLPLKALKLKYGLQAMNIGVLDDLRPSLSPLKAFKLRNDLQAVDVGVLDDLRPSFPPFKALKLTEWPVGSGYCRSRRPTAIILAAQGLQAAEWPTGSGCWRSGRLTAIVIAAQGPQALVWPADSECW